MNPTSSQALGISAFAHLRARKVSERHPTPVVEPIAVPVPTVTSNDTHSALPELKIPFAFLTLLAQSSRSTDT